MRSFRRWLGAHPLVDIHVSVARLRLRELTSFRADFLTGTLAVFAEQAIVLVLLSVLFRHTETIGRYDFPGVILLFGLALAVQSLSHMLFEGLHLLGPRHIERGEFDLMLIRPGHSLAHVLSGFFQISGVLPFFLGVGISIYALFLGSRVFFPVALFLLPLLIGSGTLVLGGILLAVSSLAFRFRRVRAIRRTMQALEGTMVYPLDVFPKGVQSLLLWVVPFGWAAFGPSRYFLSGELSWLVASMVAGPLSALFGLLVFNHFVSLYESTGT